MKLSRNCYLKPSYLMLLLYMAVLAGEDQSVRLILKHLNLLKRLILKGYHSPSRLAPFMLKACQTDTNDEYKTEEIQHEENW